MFGPWAAGFELQDRSGLPVSGTTRQSMTPRTISPGAIRRHAAKTAPRSRPAPDDRAARTSGRSRRRGVEGRGVARHRPRSPTSTLVRPQQAGGSSGEACSVVIRSVSLGGPRAAVLKQTMDEGADEPAAEVDASAARAATRLAQRRDRRRPGRDRCAGGRHGPGDVRSCSQRDVRDRRRPRLAPRRHVRRRPRWHGRSETRSSPCGVSHVTRSRSESAAACAKAPSNDRRQQARRGCARRVRTWPR